MNRHQIRVNKLSDDVTINGVSFAVDHSYIVETTQTQYRMVKALFEKITTFENDTFYDVSAWTLPLAFDFDFAALGSRDIQGNLGEQVYAEFPVEAEPDRATYAYLFSWSNYYAPRALYKLLDAGLRPKFSNKPLALSSSEGEISLPRGSILVPLGWQGGALRDDQIHELMSSIAKEDGIKVHAIGAGHTPQTGMDLGSNSFSAIEKPKVLVLVGEGITAYDAGEVWHQLDKRMNMPVQLFDKRRLSSLNLSDYTHLVIVGGNNSDLTLRKEQIKSWVRQGGTLVAMRQGAQWAYDNVLYPTSKPIAVNDAEEGRLDDGEKTDTEAKAIIGGAIMAGDLDITHPIGYGISNRQIASHRNSLIAFDPPKNPWATVIKIPEKSLLSGYASDENQADLAGKAMAIAERHGQGSVILLSDNPNFRAYFFGTNKLFMNSLFFSKGFRRPR